MQNITQKLKTFFLEIRSSIWDPAFYRSLGDRPTKNAIRYFAKLSVLIALVSSIWVLFIIVPAVRSFTDTALDAVLEAYPKNATFEIKNGVLSARPSVPYKIVAEDAKTKETLAQLGYEYSAVIDATRATFSEDLFTSYKSPVVITQNTIAMKGNNGKIELMPIQGIPNVTITKDVVEEYGQKAADFLKNLSPLFAPLAFIGFFVTTFLQTLLYMFIGALIVRLTLHLMGMPSTYWKSYAMGLHAATLPVILTLIAPVLGLPSVPFMFSLILVIVVYINFSQKK